MKQKANPIRKPNHYGFGKDWSFVKTKFKIILTAVALLWCVAFVQTLVTKWYVSNSAFQQAFAKNQIVLTENGEAERDTRNIREGNVCREGEIQGRLSREKREELVTNIFREFGGVEVMSSDEDDDNYYIVYGYTKGIDVEKHVNGKAINLSVAMSYDEKKQSTRIVVGVPFINSDI